MAKTTSVESELQAVVSVCEGDQKVSGLLLSLLRNVHFGGEETSAIFMRISTLVKSGKPVPKLSVLRHDPTLSQEAQELLRSEVEVNATEDEARGLLGQLEHFRKLRVIYKGTSEVVKSMNETTPDVERALSSLERVVLQARADYEETAFVIAGEGSNAQPVIDRVLSQETPDRIKTGFSRFDEASGGFARKDLILIAANTGGGKSVMAEQLAINAYLLEKRTIALVSFEMDEDEIYARLMSNITGIPFADVYLKHLHPGQLAKCREAAASFLRHGENHHCKLVVWCPTIDVNPTQIGAILKPASYDEIIIDYVGLVGAEKEAALWENLGEITKAFKGVARRNDCVVVVMAQLDEDTNKVKYSKAMRHHSSYVWKWNYNEESEETGQIIVEQDKARHCKKFSFSLVADFSKMKMVDAAGTAAARDVTSKEEAEEKKRPAEPKEFANFAIQEALKRAGATLDQEDFKYDATTGEVLEDADQRSDPPAVIEAPERVEVVVEPEPTSPTLPQLLPVRRGARQISTIVDVTSAEDL